MKWKRGGPYGNRKTEVLDEDGQPIAEVWTRRPGGTDNLDLIVNAPELTELASDALDYIVDVTGAYCECSQDYPSEYRCLQCKLRAVLPRAKGFNHVQ